MASNRIDINTATVDDFEQLFGIGRSKAEAIVRHRKVEQPYESHYEKTSFLHMRKQRRRSAAQ